MRAVILSIGAVLLMIAPARAACTGQVGKTIFEDTFVDDSGGWDIQAPDGVFKDGTLLLHPNPRGDKEESTIINPSQTTFHATDGDYCVEFVLPKPPSDDNPVGAGMTIWHVGDMKTGSYFV